MAAKAPAAFSVTRQFHHLLHHWFTSCPAITTHSASSCSPGLKLWHIFPTLLGWSNCNQTTVLRTQHLFQEGFLALFSTHLPLAGLWVLSASSDHFTWVVSILYQQQAELPEGRHRPRRGPPLSPPPWRTVAGKGITNGTQRKPSVCPCPAQVEFTSPPLESGLAI